MNKTTGINGTTAKPEIKGELSLQIAQYVKQQPEFKQTFHKWMKRLEVVWMGVIVLVFSAALYISIAWKSFDPTLIPIAWFAFKPHRPEFTDCCRMAPALSSRKNKNRNP